MKAPTATNLNDELQGGLSENYNEGMGASTGITTIDGIEDVVSSCEDRCRRKDLVVYPCASDSPEAFEDHSLREVERLKEAHHRRVEETCFSIHHLGAGIAALALGAGRIERHVTLDRTWKGTDHAASLEPDGKSCLAHVLKHAGITLTFTSKVGLDIEDIQPTKLKRLSNVRAIG